MILLHALLALLPCVAQEPEPPPAPVPAPVVQDPAPEAPVPPAPVPAPQEVPAAQEPAPAAPPQTLTEAAAPAPDAAAPADDVKVTRRTVTIGGQAIAYTARAGTMLLAEEDGKAKARVFFVAYTRDGVEDLAQRPVTFSFNGGPGSSSVWLHLGMLGPRRVHLSPEGWAPAPPYVLEDNPDSWLDRTDLVFIDPVTTGYSRAAQGEDDSQFHGVDEDVRWVGEFVRLWTTRNLRWGSPKFLAGESYGTTRAASLSAHLQERHGMYLNGIVLISSILDFQTARFDVGNDLPYVLFLPTYTATAWYHKKLDADLQRDLRAALDEVEAFAAGEYASALFKGSRLGAEERERVLAKLGRYTGLSLNFIDRANLRVSIGRFCKELLRADRRTTGRLDSRFLGIDLDAVGESYEYDPSYAAIQGPFSGALNDYLRRELGYESDLPYEILTGRVQPWKMGEPNRYLNVAEELRGAMTRNAHLKVFVASGYYDLATPYWAARYTFDHLGLDASLTGNLHFGFYEAGHMMYIHQPSSTRFKQDVDAFFGAALVR
jgi:carboxypeptidase C (cathepsin A)